MVGWIISVAILLLRLHFSFGDCLELGFNSMLLSCEVCDTLERIVADKGLYQECSECCSVNQLDKFELAVFECDRRFLSRFPDLKAVVKAKSELNLDVRYRFGAAPTLLMYKDRGDENPVESLNVYSWTKDVFRDYLVTHLVSKNNFLKLIV